MNCFAIPANAASNIIDQLIKYGETRRGWLGVGFKKLQKKLLKRKFKKTSGALVAGVGEKSTDKLYKSWRYYFRI